MIGSSCFVRHLAFVFLFLGMASLLTAPAMAEDPKASVASTPEEAQGCGADITEESGAKLFCARYELINQWYPGAWDKLSHTKADYHGCIEYAKATTRLRNSVCMYYKELSLFGEKAAAAKVAAGTQKMKEEDAAALNKAEQNIHIKYYGLLQKNRLEQFDRFHTYTRAVWSANEQYERQLRAEAIRCVGDGSVIPSPYLLTVSHDTKVEAEKIQDKFQMEGKKAEDIAAKYSKGLGSIVGQINANAGNMGTITGTGSGPAPKSTSTNISGEAPNILRENAWAIGSGELAELQKMLWRQAAGRWGAKFAGPIFDIGTAVVSDYLRNGKIDGATVFNALCGAISLTAGVLCTTVSSGIQWVHFRMNAYATYSYLHLTKIKNNPTSMEIAGAFCQKLTDIKKEADEKEKTMAEATRAKYVERSKFCFAMNQEMMQARESIRTAKDEVSRHQILNAYKAKYAQYLNQSCMAMAQ